MVVDYGTHIEVINRRLGNVETDVAEVSLASLQATMKKVQTPMTSDTAAFNISIIPIASQNRPVSNYNPSLTTANTISQPKGPSTPYSRLLTSTPAL